MLFQEDTIRGTASDGFRTSDFSRTWTIDKNRAGQCGEPSLPETAQTTAPTYPPTNERFPNREWRVVVTGE